MSAYPSNKIISQRRPHQRDCQRAMRLCTHSICFFTVAINTDAVALFARRWTRLRSEFGRGVLPEIYFGSFREVLLCGTAYPFFSDVETYLAAEYGDEWVDRDALVVGGWEKPSHRIESTSILSEWPSMAGVARLPKRTAAIAIVVHLSVTRFGAPFLGILFLTPMPCPEEAYKEPQWNASICQEQALTSGAASRDGPQLPFELADLPGHRP